MINIEEFYEQIINGELSSLEIDNTIEDLTKGYQLNKIALLCRDLEFYAFMDRDERIGNVSTEDINKKIEEYETFGLEIPYLTTKQIERDGQILIPSSKQLNIEALFFPYYFFQLNLVLSGIKGKLLQGGWYDSIKAKDNSIKNSKEEYIFHFLKDIDPRTNDVALEKTEYEKLIKWVKSYFDNHLKLPQIEKPIRTLACNKGTIVWAFKDLYKEYYPEGVFPDSLFILITKCFYLYRNDNIPSLKKSNRSQYYKGIQKKRGKL